MKPIPFITVNIEGKKHLHRVLPVLEERRPEIIILQEVFEVDAAALARNFGMQYAFAGMQTITVEGQPMETSGIAILSILPFTVSRTIPYGDFFDEEKKTEHTHTHPLDDHPLCMLLLAELATENGPLTVGCTHFTWSNEGAVTPLQEANMDRLLFLLSTYPVSLFCGDFNTPRGNGLFEKLGSVYRDNVPPHITTTIDGSLHRAGNLQYVVDGVFSGASCTVSNVEVLDGVSDHCALVGKLEIAA